MYVYIMQSYTYIEILILDNFLITFILFMFSSAILNIKIDKIFAILSAIFSAVINLGVPFFNFSAIGNILFKLSLGFVLCFICCLNKNIKEQFKFYITFMIATCLFGGIFFFSYYSILIPLNLINIPVGFFALIVFTLGKVTFKYVKKYFKPYISEFYYSCEILINDKKLKVNAFLDTGNLLKDKNCDKPIVIIELSVLRQILTKKQISTLIQHDLTDLRLKDLHIIEYGTIECKTKKMVVFTPDKFTIELKNGKKEVNCLLGVSLLPLFKNQNFKAIIGADIAQGV